MAYSQHPHLGRLQQQQQQHPGRPVVFKYVFRSVRPTDVAVVALVLRPRTDLRHPSCERPLMPLLARDHGANAGGRWVRTHTHTLARAQVMTHGGRSLQGQEQTAVSARSGRRCHWTPTAAAAAAAATCIDKYTAYQEQSDRQTDTVAFQLKTD